MKLRNLILSLAFVGLALSGVCQKRSTITDPRDGNTYRVVEIGAKTWMAQNLNYYIRGSWCYDNDDEKCKRYGRIYTWDVVMNNSLDEKAQGICPEGWHVPTNEEWADLVEEYHKSKDLLPNGVSGFDMLFAGCRFPKGNFDFEGKVATFWTSTRDGDSFVYTRYAYSDKKSAPLIDYSTNTNYGQYLRCVKD